jgi:hypothetical protein
MSSETPLSIFQELGLNVPREIAQLPEGELRTAPIDGKPEVMLPCTLSTISASAQKLGELLASTHTFYVRGGSTVRLTKDQEGTAQLIDASPAALASDFETVSTLLKPARAGENVRTTCSESTAKLISKSAAFKDALPSICVLTRCPVLISRGSELIQVSGYDSESGIFADGTTAPEVSLDTARGLLSELIAGFRFATPSDRSRALSSLITPAIVFGGLVRGFRSPLDLGEADDSQTGKGYRNKITAALYGQAVRNVTQRHGGVGSLEESFSTALLRGANFIAVDNVRGKIDSPAFESFLTEDYFSARSPHREAVEIDARRVVVMMTSNKAELTIDLANRSSCVRLLKQPQGFSFPTYREGDILEHVRANRAQYLGAVFSVIRAWHAAGMPRTNESRHDFRPWAQSLDWIVQNLLGEAPLLEGHVETKTRMTNPSLGWLRDVALAVSRSGQTGQWLRTYQILELLPDAGIEVPGLPEGADLNNTEIRSTALQALGRKLGHCFKSAEQVEIDNVCVTKRESYDVLNRRDTKEYCFGLRLSDGPPASSIGATHAGTAFADPLTVTTTVVCAYTAPIAAPMLAPNKTLIAPNAPDTSQMYDSNQEGKYVVLQEVMHSLGASGATSAEFDQSTTQSQLQIPRII